MQVVDALSLHVLCLCLPLSLRFSQFSRTVCDAAVNKLKVVREAYTTLTDALVSWNGSRLHGGGLLVI